MPRDTERTLRISTLTLAVVALSLWIFATVEQLFERVADVVLVFVFAWALAYLLAPAVMWLERRAHLGRLSAVLIVYAGMVVGLAIALALVVPVIVTQLSGLVTNAPIASQSVALVGATLTLLFDVTLVAIVAFFMLIDGERLWLDLLSALPADLRSEAELLRYSADRSFGGFLRGQLILGFAYGVIVLIAFLILGLPFAVLLAVSSGLLMVIPFFGAIIATFPPVLVALTQSLELAVGTFIAVAVIQNVMTNFVGPRLMAQTVGIHPLLVFAALLVGARVAGLWGVFLALPIAGILNVFARYALEVASGRRARTEASRMLSEREQRRARR